MESIENLFQECIKRKHLQYYLFWYSNKHFYSEGYWFFSCSKCKADRL